MWQLLVTHIIIQNAPLSSYSGKVEKKFKSKNKIKAVLVSGALSKKCNYKYQKNNEGNMGPKGFSPELFKLK